MELHRPPASEKLVAVIFAGPLSSAGARVPICVFLDVIKPGRSGIQILKKLNAQRYGAPSF
jgi:hypothetical protein